MYSFCKILRRISIRTPYQCVISMHTAERMDDIGNSVFASFSAMALEHNAVNLGMNNKHIHLSYCGSIDSVDVFVGQGFPNFGTPKFAREVRI